MTEDRDIAPRGQPTAHRKPILLTKRQRLSIFSIGSLSLGSGGASVFVTENQAGSTTLLLVGMILLLIGLTGRVPEQIGKEGMAYADVSPTESAVDTLMTDQSIPLPVRETVAEVVREEFNKQVSSFSDGASSVRRRELVRKADDVLFEAKLMELLERDMPHDLSMARASDVGPGTAMALVSSNDISTMSDQRRYVGIQAVGMTTPAKVRSNLATYASLRKVRGPRFYGPVYVVDATAIQGRLRAAIQGTFSQCVVEYDLSNAHLVFVDLASEKSVTELMGVMSEAWSEVKRIASNESEEQSDS